jgi:hypothetical protein
MQKTIDGKQSTIDKILRWFPIVGEYLRIENERGLSSSSAMSVWIANESVSVSIERSCSCKMLRLLKVSTRHRR